jgi:hypothetical protein
MKLIKDFFNNLDIVKDTYIDTDFISVENKRETITVLFKNNKELTFFLNNKIELFDYGGFGKEYIYKNEDLEMEKYLKIKFKNYKRKLKIDILKNRNSSN